jgi:hypothetical protein
MIECISENAVAIHGYDLATEQENENYAWYVSSILLAGSVYFPSLVVFQIGVLCGVSNWMDCLDMSRWFCYSSRTIHFRSICHGHAHDGSHNSASTWRQT